LPFTTWSELSEVLAFGRQSLAGNPLLAAAAVVLGILLVWNIAAIAAVVFRWPKARGVLLAFFAARGFVSVIGALLGPAEGLFRWWPIVLNLLLFLYVGWSADADALLGPPKRVRSETGSLGDENA
jgi:hypothetical protein